MQGRFEDEVGGEKLEDGEIATLKRENSHVVADSYVHRFIAKNIGDAKE